MYIYIDSNVTLQKGTFKMYMYIYVYKNIYMFIYYTHMVPFRSVTNELCQFDAIVVPIR